MYAKREIEMTGQSPREGVVRVLGLVGSLRRDSYNRQLLRAAVALLPPGAELVVWDDLRAIPPFSEDDEATVPASVAALRTAITTADAVLVVAPEYNASIPGQLKNALDWASRPFPDNALRGKPTAVIGASPSPGGAARSHADARKILGAIGARVLDHELAVARAYEQFNDDGSLVADTYHGALAELLDALAEAARGGGFATAQAA